MERLISSDSSKDLIIANNPKSAFAEAIKSVKTNIQFSAINQDLKTILITSPAPGDGKSFVAANLALAFAQDDKNVLIIDADLRRGRQHHIFKPKATADNKTEVRAKLGYSNLIVRCKRKGASVSSVNLSDYIYQTQYDNVSLLPAGYTPPNPLELLASAQNQRILNRLKGNYDIVLIDCPPILGLSDTIVMSKLSDVNLLVVSYAKTKKEQLSDSKKAFERVGSKITGVIINRANNIKSSYYSSYYTKDR